MCIAETTAGSTAETHSSTKRHSTRTHRDRRACEGTQACRGCGNTAHWGAHGICACLLGVCKAERVAESAALESLSEDSKAHLQAHTPSSTEIVARILAAQQPAHSHSRYRPRCWKDFPEQRRRSRIGDAQPLQQRRKQASELARSLSSVPTAY